MRIFDPRTARSAGGSRHHERPSAVHGRGLRQSRPARPAGDRPHQRPRARRWPSGSTTPRATPGADMRVHAYGSLLQVNSADPLAFHRACLEEGLYIAPRGSMNLSTPMDEAVCDEIVERVETRDRAGRPGTTDMATKTVDLLSREALDRIHADSLKILAEIGVRVENAGCREVLLKAGATGGRPDRRGAPARRDGRGGPGPGGQDLRPRGARRPPLPGRGRQAARRRARQDAEGPGLRRHRVPAAAPAGRDRPLPHHQRPAGRRVHGGHPVPVQRRAARDRRRRQPRSRAGHHGQPEPVRAGQRGRRAHVARPGDGRRRHRQPGPRSRHVGRDQHDDAARARRPRGQHHPPRRGAALPRRPRPHAGRRRGHSGHSRREPRCSATPRPCSSPRWPTPSGREPRSCTPRPARS